MQDEMAASKAPCQPIPGQRSQARSAAISRMIEILRSRWPWRRRAAGPLRTRTLLEHGAIPWLLAVAVATALPHVEFLPLWLSLFSCAVLLGRAWLWLRNVRLPRRRVLALLVSAGTIGIALQYRALLGREPGVALLVFFMALKPMEMTSRRDGLVVVMLGFFLLLTHYFESGSIFTGVWLLAAATLLTAALLRMSGGAQPVGGVFRYAVALIAQAIPFMLIFFVLFPRVQGPLWGMPQDAYSGMTGLSNRMSPGLLENLILSGEVAFRVQFATDVPDRAELYWRGPAFDSYDGQTWRTSFASTSFAADKRTSIKTVEGSFVDYTTTLEAHNLHWLLALDLPVTLPEGAAVAPTFEVLARRPVRYRSRFSFRSATEYLANVDEAPALLQQALRLPRDLNPRTRALAESWQRESVDPERISNAALRFFREEKFFYTLQPPLLGQNAVDEFLFDTRRGFCEHYAGAYVALMRAAGVPARVVTGYQGGELNPVDGFLTVRQSDAHAWAEIWLEGKGWRRIDPTAAVAPSRIEHGIDAALPTGESLPARLRLESWSTLFVRLRFRWEAINNAWDQWVLGYDPERQREFLNKLGMENVDWRRMVSIMALLCGTALLLVACRALIRRAKPAPEVRGWQRFCARLERFGIRRDPWEGPLDLAARVEREKPGIAPLVRRAAGHYAELRYGAGHREHLKALRDCTKELAVIRPADFPSPVSSRT
jgi:transglutaminase-like putative cysteine protease